MSSGERLVGFCKLQRLWEREGEAPSVHGRRGDALGSPEDTPLGPSLTFCARPPARVGAVLPTPHPPWPSPFPPGKPFPDSASCSLLQLGGRSGLLEAALGGIPPGQPRLTGCILRALMGCAPGTWEPADSHGHATQPHPSGLLPSVRSRPSRPSMGCTSQGTA